MLQLLHRLASNGRVYDWTQRLAGAREVDRKLATWIAASDCAYILDLGGGTGRVNALAPAGSRYICLDMEHPKLRQFLVTHPRGHAIMADATRVPVSDNTIQLVTCVAVSHHLQTGEFSSLLREARRVLTSTGRFVFLDAVSNPGRWQSRLLWSLDRGGYPKTSEQLLACVSEQFSIVHAERFSVHHDYLLTVATKSPAAPG